jgi:hypothetical protein
MIVAKGMWNILEVLFAAVWWMGLGRMMYNENKGLGIVTIIAGLSTLMDAAGNMTGVKILSEVGLNLYLLLGILWPVIIGIALIRKSVSSKSISPINTATTKHCYNISGQPV